MFDKSELTIAAVSGGANAVASYYILGEDDWMRKFALGAATSLASNIIHERWSTSDFTSAILDGGIHAGVSYLTGDAYDQQEVIKKFVIGAGSGYIGAYVEDMIKQNGGIGNGKFIHEILIIFCSLY